MGQNADSSTLRFQVDVLFCFVLLKIVDMNKSVSEVKVSFP